MLGDWVSIIQSFSFFAPGRNSLLVLSFSKQSLNTKALLFIRLFGIHNPISSSLKYFFIPISQVGKQARISCQYLASTHKCVLNCMDSVTFQLKDGDLSGTQIFSFHKVPPLLYSARNVLPKLGITSSK